MRIPKYMRIPNKYPYIAFIKAAKNKQIQPQANPTISIPPVVLPRPTHHIPKDYTNNKITFMDAFKTYF